MMTRLAVLLTPLLLSGCILFDGRCTYEVRSLLMKGALTGAGQPQGEPPIPADLSLNESRDGVEYRILVVTLQTASATSIQSVDVLDANPAGSILLATFTEGNTTTPGYWHSDLGHTTPAPHHSQVESAAARGHLRLIAHYANGETAEGKMRITDDGDWEHPYCS